MYRNSPSFDTLSAQGQSLRERVVRFCEDTPPIEALGKLLMASGAVVAAAGVVVEASTNIDQAAELGAGTGLGSVVIGGLIWAMDRKSPTG